jgi:hypothetical protein
MPGPVPAMVSLIGSSFGPVLIFSRSSDISRLLRAPCPRSASGTRRMFLCLCCARQGGSPYTRA